MARKNYSDEFRRQAVDLYESTPGATLRGIAGGSRASSRGTLQGWVRDLGSGKKTAADGTTAAPARRGPAGVSRRPGAGGGDAGVEIAGAGRTRAARRDTSSSTERDILRQAAKYFAGETNW